MNIAYGNPIVYNITNHYDIACLFAHGLFDSHTQAKPFAKASSNNEHYLFECPVISFDFPDTQSYFPWVNRLETNFGQEQDIACLKKYFDSCYISHNTRILMGLSRGAATAINFVALHKPSIKALLLESPFDSLESMMQHHSLFKYIWSPQLFKKYNQHGLQPIQSVEYIDSTLPIIIICSKQDWLIPYKHSVALYKKLIETGHVNTHLLILEKGHHGYLITGKNNTQYRNVIHAFLSHYALPNNPIFAEAGKADFCKTKPKINDLI